MIKSKLRIPKSARLSFKDLSYNKEINQITLKAYKNKLEHHRYRIVISSKNIKKAVIRNKIRRRMYQIIKDQANQIHSGTNKDHVFIIKLKNINSLHSNEISHANLTNTISQHLNNLI